MSGIIRDPKVLAQSADQLATSVDAFNPPLASYLDGLGLPTAGVLAPLEERKAVISALASAMSVLPDGDRAKAAYLSKFAVAATVGLFDGALAYLWDETIKALRRLATTTDLVYFFDVAEKREKYREKLKSAEDLPAIDDAELIEACTQVGLITGTVRERLRHVNFMRNHASSAHPNDDAINGHELVGWLTNCLRYAITATPDGPAVEVTRLLRNLREQAVQKGDVETICEAVANLPQPRIDDLVWTVFGMYTDARSEARVRDNVDLIGARIWTLCSDDRRHECGARHAEFVRHNEQDRKDLATRFLTNVGGLAYRTEDVLVAELLDKLRSLRAAHRSARNFYDEWPIASELGKSLPRSGLVPRAVRRDWVKNIAQCYIGNGMGYYEGVDRAALPHYQRYIDAFTDHEIAEFLRLIGDSDFTADFATAKSDPRVRSLATQLQAKTRHAGMQACLQLLIAAPPMRVGSVAGTAAYKSALALLPQAT